MREIKFRAWSEKHKLMLYDSPETIITHIYLLSDGSPLIIEQYTGLKDKNGKEIYEGDIIKRFKPHEVLRNVEEIEIFRVRWGVRKAGFFAYSKKRKKHSLPAKRLNADDVYEVIGNIHENGELLGDEN